jgi:hypothetical protein
VADTALDSFTARAAVNLYNRFVLIFTFGPQMSLVLKTNHTVHTSENAINSTLFSAYRVALDKLSEMETLLVIPMNL